MEGHTNWLALVVAALSTQVIGMIWYHPKVLGSVWMKETGMEGQQPDPKAMFIKMAISVVLMFGLAYALKYVAHGEPEHHTFKHGAYHALMDGALIIVPVIAIGSLYENKSLKYLALTVGYWLLCIVSIGGIISWWR
jgi:Protein of unknown function (DUF1761)